jgi:hypothetical protein
MKYTFAKNGGSIDVLPRFTYFSNEFGGGYSIRIGWLTRSIWFEWGRPKVC